METENLFPRPVRLRSIYTAFERELKPDYIFRGESHDFYELVMILSGTVGITAGSDSFLLKEGTAILHTPMEFHSLRAANGTSPTVLIITFFADALPDYQKRIFLFQKKNAHGPDGPFRFCAMPAGAMASGPLRWKKVGSDAHRKE